MTTVAGLPPEVLRAPLVLASASPRRQEILRQAGLPFAVVTSDAEPAVTGRHRPAEHALLSAAAKALDVAPRCPGRLVVGADTIVVLGHRILGKPTAAAEATAMLRALSGRTHEVITGLAIALGGEPRLLSQAAEVSQVTFAALAEETIAAYVATGDPLDKAGAYGIQSQGAALVAEVVGSYLNVVGLPLARLQALLAALGWEPVGEQ